jgi:hypothetical protein
MPAEAGNPVRRSPSAELLTPPEYWIVRPSAQLRTRRTMTGVGGRPEQKNAGIAAGVSIRSALASSIN